MKYESLKKRKGEQLNMAWLHISTMESFRENIVYHKIVAGSDAYFYMIEPCSSPVRINVENTGNTQ